MAQTLQGDRVNRFTISSTTNHTDESFEGNMDVSSLSSVSVLSRKKNVRIYARNAISGAWSVLAVVGPTASTVDGTGTKHHRDTTLSTTDYDRISVVTVDGADADVRVVHSSVLPSAILSRGQAASYTTEHELTSLATGVAQTIDNVSGMPIVQVFEQTTTAGAGSTELDVLRLHLDSDFTDSSTSGHTVTAVGNAAISTSEKKFGAGSAYFDGVSHPSDYLSIPDHEDFTFGTEDFTIELWIKPTGAVYSGVASGWQEVFSQGWASGDDSIVLGMHYDQGAELYFAYTTDGSTDKSTGPSSVAPTINAWNHIAIVRSTTTITVYLNGAAVASISCGTGAIYNSGKPFFIGNRQSHTAHPFNGYIDDIRITKGLARYTANFTVPTAAHPDANSAGTSTLTDKTHNYTVTHDSSTNQLSVTSASPVDTIKVRIATA